MSRSQLQAQPIMWVGKKTYYSFVSDLFFPIRLFG